MEIIKFIFTCISVVLAIFGMIAGLWSAYNKKVVSRITSVEREAREKIESVKIGSEKRIEYLENDVRDLQKVMHDSFQQRLSNIEGEMKGITTILEKIQGWFIFKSEKE